MKPQYLCALVSAILVASAIVWIDVDALTHVAHRSDPADNGDPVYLVSTRVQPAVLLSDYPTEEELKDTNIGVGKFNASPVLVGQYVRKNGEKEDVFARRRDYLVDMRDAPLDIKPGVVPDYISAIVNRVRSLRTFVPYWQNRVVFINNSGQTFVFTIAPKIDGVVPANINAKTVTIGLPKHNQGDKQ